jgi:hypothetical protein
MQQHLQPLQEPNTQQHRPYQQLTFQQHQPQSSQHQRDEQMLHQMNLSQLQQQQQSLHEFQQRQQNLQQQLFQKELTQLPLQVQRQQELEQSSPPLLPLLNPLQRIPQYQWNCRPNTFIPYLV